MDLGRMTLAISMTSSRAQRTERESVAGERGGKVSLGKKIYNKKAVMVFFFYV
jgi:hypothetical protein